MWQNWIRWTRLENGKYTHRMLDLIFKGAYFPNISLPFVSVLLFINGLFKGNALGSQKNLSEIKITAYALRWHLELVDEAVLLSVPEPLLIRIPCLHGAFWRWGKYTLTCAYYLTQNCHTSLILFCSSCSSLAPHWKTKQNKNLALYIACSKQLVVELS